MATKGKKPSGGQPTKTATHEMPASSPAASAGAGAQTMVPTGSILSSGMPPSMLFGDVLGSPEETGETMGLVAPTFGAVLSSIGEGIADSQDALDRGMVQTAQQLSAQKITVVSDVIQGLDDDGIPDADLTELVTNDVSLINYVKPTVHEWKHVALSMDFAIGSMNRESGFTFDRQQSRSGTRGSGLLWGFVGWFGQSDSQSKSSYERKTYQETDWSRGQVRMDAQLAPRELGDFPVPAQVVIGPQIFFSLGEMREALTDGVVTSREVDVTISVRKSDGSINPNVNLVLDSGPFRQAFSTDGDFNGSTTSISSGQCLVTLTRDIPNAQFSRPLQATISAELGLMTQTYNITL